MGKTPNRYLPKVASAFLVLALAYQLAQLTWALVPGSAIGRSLAQSKIFPPMSIHLISSGEASGKLDSMLEHAANHQENEMNSLLGTMLGVLGPALIILMRLMVLVIVMAILLPIFQINQLVA